MRTATPSSRCAAASMSASETGSVRAGHASDRNRAPRPPGYPPARDHRDQTPVELHIVSDSTGETAARLVLALEAQFPDQPFAEIRHPRVETIDDLQLAVRPPEAGLP